MSINHKLIDGGLSGTTHPTLEDLTDDELSADQNSVHTSDEAIQRRQLKLEKIAYHMRHVIEALGLDLNDPNLRETDRRVAKMYLEMFAGLEQGSEPKVTTFPNEEHYNEMVMVKEIPFYSMCSHHFVPFYGHAHIAYIPRERIVGLSKLPRIVEFYARRPQLQERLTEQIINFMEDKLQPQGSMVVIEARHMCMEMRGVKKCGAKTATSAIRGVFNDRKAREEFLDLLRLPR